MTFRQVFFVRNRARFGKYFETMLQKAIFNYVFPMISDYGCSFMVDTTNFFAYFRVGMTCSDFKALVECWAIFTSVPFTYHLSSLDITLERFILSPHCKPVMTSRSLCRGLMRPSLQCAASSSFKLRAITSHSTDQAGIIKRACPKAVYCLPYTSKPQGNSRILLPSKSFSASH